jgi:nitroimidazol reductase NimA-like FMN-containing flavoprotein (pyridoxamine 5'-phosphate oxidase superfamily)
MSGRPSDRIRIRRNPKKGRYDRDAIDAILERSGVGHVAFVDDGQPFCIPTLCARVGERVYIHGSRASRTLRVLARGGPACLTVTAMQGLVLARSVFEHSVNYESVIAFGRFATVDEPAERLAALEAFTDKVLPGRWSEVRPPCPKELKATTILAMEIEEAAAKVRFGPPDDDGTPDAELDVWAGELPIVTTYGAPVPSPGLRPGIPLAASVRRLFGDLRGPGGPPPRPSPEGGSRSTSV